MREKNEKKKNELRGGLSSSKRVEKRGRFKLSSLFSGLEERFVTERSVKLTGACLLLISLYLFIAFISFIFTWKYDQDKVMTSWIDLFFSEIKVDNWLGKLGAIVSHKFIHSGFGIASFVFPAILFIAGFKLLFKITLLSLTTALKHSFFILIWGSLALGYLFKNSLFFLGGSFGYVNSTFLNGALGVIGNGLFLTFAFLSYLVVAFNLSFSLVKKTEEINTEANIAEEDINSLEITNSFKEIINEPETTSSETITTEIDFETNNSIDEDTITKETSPESIEESDSNIEFSVEQNTETTETEAKEDTKENTDLLEKYGEYDPTLELSSYQFPELDLLNDFGTNEITVNKDELNANKDQILRTLANYNIQIEKIKATIGPTVTLYEIIPAPGVRISKIKNLEDDIALSLSALGIRIIAPIPGKGTIGIEVPNQKPEMVSMRSILSSEKFKNSSFDLPIALGKTISNDIFIADLAKMPHLLMAGATGQGKSVGLNAILTSLLYKKHPSQLKLVLVDPKKVELALFNKIERHFLAKLSDSEEPIITDTKKVIHTLNSLCKEMDDRYELLKEAGVRNLKEYNTKFIARKLNPNNGHRFLPFIVLIVDEFADLIMTAGKEVETPIARLAQLARAIGIHLIIATQRPSVNIITGTIKANFPARIAFKVSSKVDSRTILDNGGAEQLIGRGDMLLSTGNDIIRIQCAFVDTPEVEKIAEFIGSQRAYPSAYILPEVMDETSVGEGNGLNPDERDAMFEEAAKIVVQHQQGSASLLQRRLKLGYNRAGRIVDQLEAAGIIGPFEGSKAREVLIKDMISLEQFLKSTASGGN